MVRAVQSKLPRWFDAKWAIGLLVSIVLSLAAASFASVEHRVSALEQETKTQVVKTATTETELKDLLKQNEKDHKAIQQGVDQLIQMHLKPSQR